MLGNIGNVDEAMYDMLNSMVTRWKRNLQRSRQLQT